MGLETVTHISDLVITNPVGTTDFVQYGDDHIRNIKIALKTDFPNITGAVTASQAELNVLDGYTGNTNDLNILAGAAAAGVTATELQYLNGVGGLPHYSGGTDVPVADGGTGASNAAGARTNLGVGAVGTLALLPETYIDWANGAGITQLNVIPDDQTGVTGTSFAAHTKIDSNSGQYIYIYVPPTATALNYRFLGSTSPGPNTVSFRLTKGVTNGTASTLSNGTAYSESTSGSIDITADSGGNKFTAESKVDSGTGYINQILFWFS